MYGSSPSSKSFDNLGDDCSLSVCKCFKERKHALLCNATTLKINPKLRTSTMMGSTFSPGLSSVYSSVEHIGQQNIPSLSPVQLIILPTDRGVLSLFPRCLCLHLTLFSASPLFFYSPAIVPSFPGIPQSHFRDYVLSMVLELPPAPAARVLVGRVLATLSARSAAAFLRMAVLGPPGGVGDDWRAVVLPTDGEVGEEGRGSDCRDKQVSKLVRKHCAGWGRMDEEVIKLEADCACRASARMLGAKKETHGAVY